MHELKSPRKITKALSNNILETLTNLLNDYANDLHPEILEYSLVLLHILSIDFDASMAMAGNEILIKTIIDLIPSENELSTSATAVLLSLSSINSGKKTSVAINSNKLENSYILQSLQLPISFCSITITSRLCLKDWQSTHQQIRKFTKQLQTLSHVSRARLQNRKSIMLSCVIC